MIDTNLELNNEENSWNEASTSHNPLSQTSICTFSLFFLTQNWINAPNHHFMTVNWQVYGKLMLTTDFLLISKRQMYIILVCNCIKNAIQQKKFFHKCRVTWKNKIWKNSFYYIQISSFFCVFFNQTTIKINKNF